MSNKNHASSSTHGGSTPSVSTRPQTARVSEDLEIIDYDWRLIYDLVTSVTAVVIGVVVSLRFGLMIGASLGAILLLVQWSHWWRKPLGGQKPRPEILLMWGKYTSVILWPGYRRLPWPKLVFTTVPFDLYPENIDFPKKVYTLPDGSQVEGTLVVTGWPDVTVKDLLSAGRSGIEYIIRGRHKGVRDALGEAIDPIANQYFASRNEGPQTIDQAQGAAFEVLQRIAKALDPEFHSRFTDMKEEVPTEIILHWVANPASPWGEFEKPYFAKLNAETEQRKAAIRAKAQKRLDELEAYRRGEIPFHVRWLGYFASRLDYVIKPTEASAVILKKKFEEVVEKDELDIELKQGATALKKLTTPIADGGWGMRKAEAREHLRKHGRLGGVQTTQTVNRIEIPGLSELATAIINKLKK